MNFNPMAFIENLEYMGVGMLSILIVMGVIIAITAGLNYITSRTGKNDEDEDKK